jgi:hypothetical protein
MRQENDKDTESHDKGDFGDTEMLRGWEFTLHSLHILELNEAGREVKTARVRTGRATQTPTGGNSTIFLRYFP